MKLIQVYFDNGSTIVIECEGVKVSGKGVEIVGGECDGGFCSFAHGAVFLRETEE